MFGSWTTDIEGLHKKFIDSGSVKYVAIENFFTEEWANKLHDDFPLPGTTDAPWKKFDDPVEKRFIMWNIEQIPSIVDTIKSVHSSTFINIVEKITGFEDIIIDPCYKHATGIAAYPRDGKLSIHLDVNINMESRAQRVCNLLVYLNKDWKDEYNGNLQVGDTPYTCKDIVAPHWNTAIIMENSPVSYHGLPKRLKCPDGYFRKNLAIYYSCIASETADMRFRSQWFPSSDQVITEKLKKFYETRTARPITDEDLKSWPTWREETEPF